MAKVVKDPALLDPRSRELVILSVVAVTKVPMITHCHRQITADLGFSEAQFEEGLQGQVPSGLSEKEQAAYELGRKLTLLNGPLDDEAWKKATSQLEKTEITTIIHIVSGYKWISMLDMVNADSSWSKGA